MAPPAAVLVCAAAPAPADLERRLGWAREAGVSSAVVALPFGARALRERFGDGSRVGLPVRFFVDERPLGTAGALKALGAASLPDDVLVLAGEETPRFSGARLVAFHGAHDALATLVVHRCRHAPPCAPVVLGPGRRVVELPPRPLVGGYAFGLSPVWLVRRALLRLAGDALPCDLERDVFPRALKAGEPLAGFSA